MSITVHQVVPVYGYADAIGNQVSETRKLLQRLGVSSNTFADHWDPLLSPVVQSMDEYRRVAREDSWTILHLGVCGRANDLVRDLPGRTVIYYHNLTPASFYLLYNPVLANCMRHGRRQLMDFHNRARMVAASDYNRRELEQLGFHVDAVAPYVMLLDQLKLGVESPVVTQVREKFREPGIRTWLYVGRLAPNKKVDDVVRAFHFYRTNFETNSRLLLVGSAPENDKYVVALHELIKALDLADSVVFPGHLPAEALGVFYEIADAYICLSEHEGFCVPLVEAMSFDLPVVAFASTGMPSTMGDSGVLLHRKEPALVAEVMHEVLTNQALRQGLITRQRRRVADFAPDKMRLQLHRSLIAAGIPLPEPQTP